jgi:iron complex outermembrane recepter protein
VHRRLQRHAPGFAFKLNHALVQRRDLSGADFIGNAGDMKQKGAEFNADFLQSYTGKSFVDHFRIIAAYTYNHFRYGSFVKGTDDFSGKTVPSVPANTFSLLSDLYLRCGIYSNATYYSASEIFLNDANTAIADPYHLLGWRSGWKKTFSKKYKVTFYAGADNLLDERYSLGNDINAPAGRFYNAAPGRNYYVGLAFQWMKTEKKN